MHKLFYYFSHQLYHGKKETIKNLIGLFCILLFHSNKHIEIRLNNEKTSRDFVAAGPISLSLNVKSNNETLFLVKYSI